MIEINDARGVIFDLDGTLVSSNLDFFKIRQQIACPKDMDLLSFIEAIPIESERNQASAVVLQHELDDAQHASWLSGAQDFVESLVQQQIPLAIVTRNCPQATAIKIRNNQVPIDLVLTRNDAPAKPKPDALLMVARQWQIPPDQLLYVGDYIYDELAAQNAGMPFQYSPFGI